MKDIEKLSSQPGPLNRLARFLIDTARMKRHEHQIGNAECREHEEVWGTHAAVA